MMRWWVVGFLFLGGLILPNLSHGGKWVISEVRLRRSSLDEGQTIRVRWLDGDSFHSVGSSRSSRIKARLYGYNTLENYGPVHRWGSWTPLELDRINDQATRLAQSKRWDCEILPGGGGYGRALVKCEGLAKALIRQGLAHVYSVRGRGEASWLPLQEEAQKARRGIWAKGIPAYIVTSVHSADRGRAYNRLISTRDGSSRMMEHSRRYRVCEWVCSGGSCMLFVPYRQRYGNRKASCLHSQGSFGGDEGEDDSGEGDEAPPRAPRKKGRSSLPPPCGTSNRRLVKKKP